MNDPGCEYGLGGRWEVVQGAVRPESVVFLSPSFDEHLSLPEGVEDLSIQQFVSEFPVEAFTVAVFQGATGFSVESLYRLYVQVIGALP